MAFQSSVNTNMGFGVVGEVYNESPIRSRSFTLVSDDASYNVHGRAFTVVSEGVAKAGGTGAFAGILINPKASVLRGTTAGGTLAASLTLANYEQGELMTMGSAIVAMASAASIGYRVAYNTTTGVLSTVPAKASFTGAISTTTLTVSAVASGSAPIQVGMEITGANVTPGTIITALGTGTGGTGTYTVSVSQTAASAAIEADSLPASGTLFVPNAKVDVFAPTGAGLGVITLTN